MFLRQRREYIYSKLILCRADEVVASVLQRFAGARPGIVSSERGSFDLFKNISSYRKTRYRLNDSSKLSTRKFG